MLTQPKPKIGGRRSGQATVEYILLIAVVLGAMAAFKGPALNGVAKFLGVFTEELSGTARDGAKRNRDRYYQKGSNQPQPDAKVDPK